ncbi:MAG: pyridoxal phosphate-dependent aminotransferase [Candidatus Bathyarchaeia archaeon]|jgi:aspartate/methionine/tyrosine aminotransferase
MDFLAKKTDIAGSATIQLLDRVKELKRAGHEVISLSAGEPDFVTPEHIRTYAKRALDEGYTFYSDSAGLIELREAIAEKLRRDNGIEADSKNGVVVTVGGKEAIYAAMMATIDLGDEVIVPDPCWVSYVPCILLAGGQPVYLPTDLSSNFRISAERLEEIITRRTKMLVINTPNNPTGSVIHRDELEAIADLAKRKEFLVLSDELYEKIIFDSTEHVSIGSLPGMEDFTVTVNGFSKAYAMTGWRLGYLAAPPPIAERVVTIHGHMVTGACTFAQRAIALAMRDDLTEKTVDEMVAEYSKRRDLVVDELGKITGVNCTKPQGTFYAFPNISHYGLRSADFALKLLDEAKVAVVPGDSFGSMGEGYVRLSFATSRDNLTTAFNRMRHVISEIHN